ncbi:DNA-binding transcriptional regulator [uncultured Ruegeria sp.]|uniref:DNA-binding transcriptional regulator n=1 Tax=uncultured Ruegeria sp. TaxID=259304 RepID=UPI002630EEC4|nr:DNA-binding transcriptional regulator [uncultured Ruegeria sp.]
MPSFNNIRSVERTLSVLQAMNEGNLSRISDLQDKTGLPSATVVRIIETLVSLGYVQNHGRRIGYTLTEKVLELSSGFHGLPLILESAKSVLLDLTEAIRWPAAMATLDNVSMVVRLSTIPESPLAHTHSTLQKRLELLVRAHGRAYLAHCPDEERHSLYRKLIEQEVTQLDLPELDARMRPILSHVRHLGYAERDHEIDPQTTTVAMPVFFSGRLSATIGVTFFRGARADRKSILEHMQRALDKLEALEP